MTTRSESLEDMEATTSLAPLAPEGIESLPTFFELYAAERLVGTLQDAMSYALSVYGQRSAFCRRLLDRQDEFFFLLRVLLENATLRSSHASFSEAVYGMRRVAQSKSSGRSAQGLPTVLTPAQRRLSLMLLTLAPFLKAKLLAMHKSIMSEELGERRDGEETDASAAMLPLLRRGQYSQAAKALSRRVFPGAYIMAEGVNLCYKFAYLVQLSPYYSPLLHVLGLRVTRVSPQDAAALREAKDATRHAQLASCSMLGQLYLKSRYFLNDHATSFIIVLVFAFKVVEWWYVVSRCSGYSRSSHRKSDGMLQTVDI
jgi:peroxin-12